MTLLENHEHPNEIVWRLHLSSPPEKVYRQISSDLGRAAFWAESAVEEDGLITFRFPSGIKWRGEVLAKDTPHRFQVVYFGGSVTTFDLESDNTGGTVLRLSDKGVHPEDYHATYAGWISVLMVLKGAVDFGVDLRNHDPDRNWDQGFVDN